MSNSIQEGPLPQQTTSDRPADVPATWVENEIGWMDPDTGRIRLRKKTVEGIRQIDADAINAAIEEWRQVGVKVNAILDLSLKLLPKGNP